MRSETSLIQIIGRAARNVNGKVIMYADSVTGSMERAIVETYRRRSIQEKYNQENKIIPKTVYKHITDSLIITKEVKEEKQSVDLDNIGKMSSLERKQLIASLEKQMKEAAKKLDFEQAMVLRDIIFELRTE